MARSDENSKNGNIYKSSGGFIPGLPESTWFGVPKSFYEKVCPGFPDNAVLVSFTTGKGVQYNSDYAQKNKGKSEQPTEIDASSEGVVVIIDDFGDLDVDASEAKTVVTVKKLVSINEETGFFSVDSSIKPIFTCTSNGWGEVYEGFGSTNWQGADRTNPSDVQAASDVYNTDISPNANPTTTAVKRALVNAAMSMFASVEFYVYMLSKSYVYKDVAPFATQPPQKWLNTIIEEIEIEFNIPSFPQDTIDERDVLPPNQHPSYGTRYDPSSPMSPSIQAEYYANNIGTTVVSSTGEGGYNPQNESMHKPLWVEEWSALWEEDVSIAGANVDNYNNASLMAPVYEGKVKIDAEVFLINFLESRGIVRHDVNEAAIQYQNILTYELGFDADKGETVVNNSFSIPGFSQNIPLSSVDPEIIEDVDKAAFEVAKKNKIAKNLKVDLVEVEGEEPFQIGPIFSEATHFINNLAIDKAKNGDFEERQFYSKYLKNEKVTIMRLPKESTSNHFIATSLSTGTTVKVTNEYLTLGKGKYHRIQIVDPASELYQSKAPLFIRSCLLSKLPNELPSLPRVYKEYEKSKKPKNWFDFEDEAIFFDSFYKAYSIVVEPVDPSTGQKVKSLGNKKCSTKVQDLEPVAILHGIEALMRCYNKAPLFENDDDLSQTLNYLTSGVFQFAYSKSPHLKNEKQNWYLGERPDSNLRMIVRIPAKYFDALPENIISNNLFAPQAISFITCNLSHKIKKATDVMRVHKSQIDKFTGKIEHLNLDMEIKRLESFPKVLEKFIEENGIKFNRDAEDEIEMGVIPNDYSVLYIEYSSAGRPIRLKKCFNKFVTTDPMFHPRTIAYLSYLDEIVDMGSPNTSQDNGWETLATQYTFPTPAIKLASPVAAEEIINEKTAENLAEELDLLDVLTASNKLLQDDKITSPEMKTRLASIRSKQKDFAGDAFTASLPIITEILCNLPKNNQGLLDLFDLVFDKIDIPKLASLSASSMMKNMSFPDMQASFAMASIDSPQFGEMSLKKLFSALPSGLKTQVEMAESFLNGNIDIGSLEGAGFPDFVLDDLLSYFDNINLQSPQNSEQCTEETKAKDPKYSTMPVEDAKCLTENKPQKYSSNKNTLTKCSSERTDLIKIIVPEEDLIDAIKISVPDIFDSISSIGSVEDFDIPSPGSLSINIPAIKLPKPPTLPKFSLQKIDDTMKGVAQELSDGLTKTFAEIMIELSCDLLNMVYDEIFSTSIDIGLNGTDGTPIDFGGEDMNNFIDNGASELFESIGVTSDVLDDTPPKEIISEISQVITPLEAIDLLEGTARKETVNAVEKKIRDINPKMARVINTNSSTRELFTDLGKLADPTVLENTRTAMTEILPNITGLLCEAEKTMFAGEGITPSQVARIEALEDKLDSECIETQINNQDQLKKEKLAHLLSLAAGANALDGKIPKPLDTCGAGAKSSPNGPSIPVAGFINKNHPTVDYLNKKIVKAVFDPIKMNFSEEANSIINIYSEQNFRNPTLYEDQYTVLEQQIEIDGLDVDFKEALLGNLDFKDQAKFDQIAAPFRRLDVQIAPKMRKLLSKKVGYLYDQTGVSENNKGLRIVPSATASVRAAGFNELEDAQRKLSGLQQISGGLKSKLDFITQNPSSPFSVDFDNIQNEIKHIENNIKDARESVNNALGSFNNTSADNTYDMLPGTELQPQEYPFYYYSGKYPPNFNKNNFVLSDTWTFAIPQDTATGLFAINQRTTGFASIADAKQNSGKSTSFAQSVSLAAQALIKGDNDQCEDTTQNSNFILNNALGTTNGRRESGESVDIGDIAKVIKNYNDSSNSSPTFDPSAVLLAASGLRDVVIQGQMPIDRSIAELTNEFSFFPNYTVRDQVFANLIKEKWESINGNINVNFGTSGGSRSNSSFFDYFRQKRPAYFAALVNMFGAQITQSKLFNVNNFANLEFGESMQIQKDFCDNLLALEDLKDSANKQYQNTCDDNQSSALPGAIEEANLTNLIKASIRTIIIQLVSESIFLFSQYSFEKSIKDDALVQFIMELVIYDLQKQDQEYYEEMLNQNEKYIEKRKEDGEKLVDPFSDSSETDPILESDSVSKTDYLQYTIKEELKTIAPLIDKKIKPSSAGLDEILMSNIIPQVDVAYHKDQNRFQTLVQNEPNAPSDTASATVNTAQLKNEFKFLHPSDPLFKQSGGFILERYIRIEDSDLIVEGNESLNQKEKTFGESWFSRNGGRDNKDVDATLQESLVFSDDRVSPESFSHTSGVVNRTALIQQISNIMEDSNAELGDVDFRKFVKDFRYGLRLVYIPPAPKDKVAASNYISGGGGNLSEDNKKLANIFAENVILDAFEEVTDIEILQAITGNTMKAVYDNSIVVPNSPATKEAIVESTARKEKAYKITETVISVEPAPDDTESSLNFPMSLEANRLELFPIPLIEIENDLGFFDAVSGEIGGKVSLESLLLGLDSSAVTNLAFAALKKKMISSDKYKLLFGYDLPLKRIITILFAHNAIAASKNYPEIKQSYDQTKELIRANFFNMIPGDPWWSKQDKEIEQAGGNAGLMADANNSMTPSGPSGSKIAAKIVAKAALILVKAYAKQTDPHYKIMSILDDFGLTIDGMTWLSVPALYPVNFPPIPPGIPGWGPPMTPTGMIAYSLPLLPGEIKKKKNKNKEQGKSTDDSTCKDK